MVMSEVIENRDFHPKHDFGIRKMELVRLIEGFSGERSSSSVTLVKTPTSTVVVDSGSSEVRDELSTKMRENEAKIEKVNVLVSTMPDEIHSGNDDLFVHCLQHIREGEWSQVPVKTNRRVAITTSDHWIDKYLRIVSLPFPE
jgi:predicted PP-loop superfamily ATPase